MNFKLTVLLGFVALVLFGASAAVYTVDQREQAILLHLGQPVGAPRGPGLHFKIPVVQTVRTFDARILSVDPAPEQMVIASDHCKCVEFFSRRNLSLSPGTVLCLGMSVASMRNIFLNVLFSRNVTYS